MDIVETLRKNAEVAAADGCQEEAEGLLEAANEITVLRAEVERHKMWSEQLDDALATGREWCERAGAAERHNAALRKALGAFTFPTSNKIGDDHYHDNYEITASIPIKEIRAARAAFSSAPPAESRDTMLDVVKAAANETDAEDEVLATESVGIVQFEAAKEICRRAKKLRRAAVSAHRKASGEGA